MVRPQIMRPTSTSTDQDPTQKLVIGSLGFVIGPASWPGMKPRCCSAVQPARNRTARAKPAAMRLLRRERWGAWGITENDLPLVVSCIRGRRALEGLPGSGLGISTRVGITCLQCRATSGEAAAPGDRHPALDGTLSSYVFRRAREPTARSGEGRTPAREDRKRGGEGTG